MADKLCLPEEGVCTSGNSTGSIKMNKKIMDVDSQLITTTSISVGTIVKVFYYAFDRDVSIRTSVVRTWYVRGQIASLTNRRHGGRTTSVGDSST